MRYIGRLMADELGSGKTNSAKSEESFSFTVDRNWRLEMELELDHPRYLATREDLKR
jgi:hypothetical protein